MCARFVLKSPLRNIVEEFDIRRAEFDPAPNYNVAPTEDVAVVFDDGGFVLSPCTWGFAPPWRGGCPRPGRL